MLSAAPGPSSQPQHPTQASAFPKALEMILQPLSGPL